MRRETHLRLSGNTEHVPLSVPKRRPDTRRLVQSYLTGKNGETRHYIVDLDNRTMWLADLWGSLGLAYRPPTDPWVVIFPIGLISILFFRGNPVWAWSLKEVDRP